MNVEVMANRYEQTSYYTDRDPKFWDRGKTTTLETR